MVDDHLGGDGGHCGVRMQMLDLCKVVFARVAMADTCFTLIEATLFGSSQFLHAQKAKAELIKTEALRGAKRGPPSRRSGRRRAKELQSCLRRRSRCPDGSQ